MTRIKDIRISLGITLSLIGVVLGNFIRCFTGLDIVNPLMIISILFMADYHNLLRLRFPSFNKDVWLLLLSQIIILFYFIFSCAQETNITQSVFLYYSILMIFIVSSLPLKELKTFQTVFYIVSTLTAFMAISLFFNGTGNLYSGNIDRDYLSTLEKEGQAMVFLYPTAGVYHTASTLCFYRSIKSNVIRNLALVFLLLDFILIITSGKRTVVLIYILYIIYHVWNERKLSSIKNILKFLPFIIIFFVVVSIVFSNLPFINDFIESFWTKLEMGISTLFGVGKGDVDPSAEARVQLRYWAADVVNSDFKWYNYLFGYGYMTKYMDQPLLQCLFDMGLVGIFVYIYNVLIVTIKSLGKKTTNANLLFFKLICINVVLTCLTAGAPYGYQMYCPILFLLYATTISKRKVIGNEYQIKSYHQ